MSTIRSRKHSPSRPPHLAQSLVALAIGVPLIGAAQNPPQKTMAPINVNASAAADVPYKAEVSANPKLTQPLVDTTQTVTVIRKEVLQEQGAITLMDALRNTPGITLQMGENGNTSAGDTFQMRGFSTQSSIFVDGIRDLGPVTRDVFNIEQIEVSKGPAGSDVGRGAASGYINLSTKLPTLEDALLGTASVDSGETKRLSADLNRKTGVTSAFRLNVLGQEGGLMGRKVIEKELYGVAPAFAFGLGTPTRLYLYSQHIRQDGVPDGGIASIGLKNYYHGIAELDNAPAVDRNNYYGFVSDFEKIDADMATVKLEHDFGNGATVTNTTRWGKSSMDRILTGINGIEMNASGPADWRVERRRQSVLQENRILANTTNLNGEFRLGGLTHSVAAGLEFMSEEQFTPTRAGLGSPATGNRLYANLYNPSRNDVLVGYNPVLTGAFSQGQTDTAAAYLFDTIKLNEQWQVNAGIRAEHYNTVSNAVTITNNNPVSSRLEKSDNLFSWKAGVLYKPAVNGSVYLAYATSQTPPGSANFSLSSAINTVNNPAMDPQKTKNVELGTKWDLIEKKLAVTAAVYRTDNENEFSLVDTVTNTYSQLGKRRVQGLEVGVVGQITRAWNVTAGFASMRTRILEGATGNNAAGSSTRWSPDYSATLWTSYKWNDALTVAGGVRYMDEQKRVVAPAAALANGVPAIPSYTVADAMLSYQVARNIALQLNLYNLTDESYVASLNNGGSRLSIGLERSAMLSANFQF